MRTIQPGTEGVDRASVEHVVSGDRTRVEWSASFEFPYRARAALNLREDWRVGMTRKKHEREALYYAWVAAMKPRPPCLPVEVTFTRIAPSSLDEGDNLESAFKSMRDELARCLGLKGDTRKQGYIPKRSQQEKRGREYAVRVLLEAKGERGARP